MINMQIRFSNGVVVVKTMPHAYTCTSTYTVEPQFDLVLELS